MLKHKKFLSLLLLLPVFSVFSCSRASETYSISKHEDETNKLTYTLPQKWSEVHTAPFDLEFDGLSVKFNGDDLTNRVTSLESAKSANTYFICTSDSVPSKTIINNFHVNLTNTNVNTTLTFYIAHFDYKGESKDSVIHLSEKVTINVNNPGAFAGPWVIPVISIGVAIIVLLMIFLTRKYKAKKEGKI